MARPTITLGDLDPATHMVLADKLTRAKDGRETVHIKGAPVPLVQLGVDQNDMMRSVYGLDDAYPQPEVEATDEQGTSASTNVASKKERVMRCLIQPQYEGVYRNMDEHVKTEVGNKVRGWYGKAKKLEVKSFIVETPDGPAVKVKVNPDTTAIYEVSDDNKASKASIESLVPGCECLVLVEMKSLWIRDQNQCGIVMRARTILVKPGNGNAYGIDSMILAPGLDFE